MVGAIGGMLAILLLGVVKVALVDPLAADFALIAAPETINFGVLVVVLLLGAWSACPRWAPACRCGASCASERLTRQFPALGAFPASCAA